MATQMFRIEEFKTLPELRAAVSAAITEATSFVLVTDPFLDPPEDTEPEK